MEVGYVTVAGKEPQRDALFAHVCGRVFDEKISSREAFSRLSPNPGASRGVAGG